MIVDQSEKFGGRPYACLSADPFRLFINNNGMVDLGFSGNPFTWSNNRDGVHLIKERLDRGLASSQWIHLFSSFSVQHLPAITSDHNALLLQTTTPLNNLPRPFKFEEFWTKDPSCRNVISTAWSSVFVGSPAYSLTKKLKATKNALKTWNKHHFGHIQSRISTLTRQLDIIQQSTTSEQSLQAEISIKQDLTNLFLQEEIFWKNKSRETWLTCKDLNTKFFHTSTLIKRRRNAITTLKLPSGAWVSDRASIGSSFTNHFSSLFALLCLLLIMIY
jgi:hypothetical protein